MIAAGLDQYVQAFAGIPDERFAGLLMQDYASFGITELEDKQRLFRLLKALNADIRDRPVRPPGQQRAQAAAPLAVGADLLDLDAHDGDLLAHACGPALQLSPMGGGRPKAAAGGGKAAPYYDEPDNDDDDEMMAKRDELMDTILEEEEQLITAHRMQIEETMELVRKEMSLLTDVDQPGSAIDRYVEKLDAILKIKMDGILELKSKLERFKDHLKQEEIMSATVRPGKGKW